MAYLSVFSLHRFRGMLLEHAQQRHIQIAHGALAHIRMVENGRSFDGRVFRMPAGYRYYPVYGGFAGGR